MSNKIKSIQVLGSGCPTCKQLFEAVKSAAEELKIDTPVEYINDVAKIIEMGVMTSPALVVNGKPVLTGRGHSQATIKSVLEKNIIKDSSGCGCCCGNC